MQEYPEQYKTLIDEETWAFIRRTESFFPSDAVESTIDEQRRLYNKMCDGFATPYPANVTAKDTVLSVGDTEYGKGSSSNIDNFSGNVSQRLYQLTNENSTSAIVYLHGGGFVVGDLESHDSVCADICANTGVDVIATDYRLIPEHSALASYTDALAAYDEACKHYESIILCGDSAGANLCAAVAHTIRNRHTRNTEFGNSKLRGQVLIYAGLGASLSTVSAITHQHAPMLTLADVQYYDNLRGTRTDNDYRLAPLLDNNFTSLPPTICVSAECDPLADDGKQYCEKIIAAGGSAEYILEAGLVHGYLRARHTVARAQASFYRICQALKSFA